MPGPFKMKGHTLPGPNQASPAKQTEVKETEVKEEEKTLSIKDDQWKTMTTKEKDDYIYRNTPGGNPYTNPENKEFYGTKTGSGYEKEEEKEETE